jgi:hypothetical protein
MVTRLEACRSSSCITLMSARFARSNVEHVCRNVCHPMRLFIPIRRAVGRITLRIMHCPHAATIGCKRAVPARKCRAAPTDLPLCWMPQQLRPVILFSEPLTRFRNRGCESLHFERVNEHIEQLIQNQLLVCGRIHQESVETLELTCAQKIPLLIAGGKLVKQGHLIQAHDTLLDRCPASSCVRSASCA